MSNGSPAERRAQVEGVPMGGLLRDFVELNNRVLADFSDEERLRIGVHTCPGGDQDSTHSADVDYALLLPDLFALRTRRPARLVSWRAAPGVVPTIFVISSNGTANKSCSTNARRSGGASESSTTSSSSLTETASTKQPRWQRPVGCRDQCSGIQ